MKILFVCHGNICRSPMAEFMMADLLKKANLKEVEVDSAATSREEIGNSPHWGTVAKMKEKGIPMREHHAWQITSHDAERYDLIIGMDAWNMGNLRRMLAPELHDRLHLLLEFAGKSRDIADPWYTGNFDDTYDDILEGCTGLLKYLKDNGFATR